MSDSIDEEARLLLCAQGTDVHVASRAFRELLDLHRGPLFGFIRKSLTNLEDAEDVFQEVCLKAWENIQEQRRWTNFRGWLYHVSTNAIRDYWRKQRKHNNVQSTYEMDDTTDCPMRPVGSPVVDELQRIEDAEVLECALQQLDPEVRFCVLLSKREGFTYDEIATILDLPAGTVASHIHKGMQKLRETLTYLFAESHRNHSQAASAISKLRTRRGSSYSMGQHLPRLKGTRR